MLGRLTGQALPPSLRPLLVSPLSQCSEKTSSLRSGDLGPSRLLAWAWEACAAEGQGDTHPKVGHCSAACSPILSHVGAHCCVSEGKSGGGSEGRLCGLSGWFSAFRTTDEDNPQPDQPEGGLGPHDRTSLGRGEGFEAATQRSRH